MTKLKQMKRKYLISVGLFIFVSVIAVGIGVKAFSSNEAPQTVMENVEIGVYNEASEDIPPVEEFGALTSPDLHYNYMCNNNDCTYHLTGDMINASTTIVSVPTPFLRATSTANDVVLQSDNTAFGYTGATSTVELVRLNTTGTATSTYSITCGASASITAAPDWNILSSDSIATSSVDTVIENDVATAAGARIGGGTVDKIFLGATQPYLVCNVTTDYEGAFTEATNTFAGKYMVRISKTRY